MAQVGVLGYLKYNTASHSWALDLGMWLSSIEIAMDETVPGRHDDPGDAIHDINGALKSRGIEYAVPNTTRGEDLDPRTVLSDILGLVEKKDRTLGAFLLIGAAHNFLKRAAATRAPETVLNFRKRARKRIETIWRRNEGIKVNAAALYDLLAEPPHGDQELRTKLQRASQPLVILFLTSVPSGQLDITGEREALGKIVQTTVLRNAFKVEDVPSCSFEDITDSLLRHEPTLLHFSGRGTPEGYHFQQESGEVAVVKAVDFAKLLAIAHKNGLGLKGVVMNACHAANDGQLLADATGYAIAMDGRWSARGAIAFTKQFYGSLGNGETFEEAFKIAVAGTGLDPRMRGLNPKLFQRAPRSPKHAPEALRGADASNSARPPTDQSEGAVGSSGLAWMPAQQIGGQNTITPALATFQDELVMVYRSTKSAQLIVTTSTNGWDWSHPLWISGQQSSMPALAALKGRLYMVYTDKHWWSSQLWYTSTLDGTTWNSGRLVPGQNTNVPAIVAFRDYLFMVYSDKGSTQLWQSQAKQIGSDGELQWTNTRHIEGQHTSIPALAVFEGQVVMVYTDAHSSQLWVSLYDGTNWHRTMPIAGQNTSVPALTATKDWLVMTYRDANSSQFWRTRSRDGFTWQDTTHIDGQHGDIPALATIGSTVWMTYSGAHSSQLWVTGSSCAAK